MVSVLIYVAVSVCVVCMYVCVVYACVCMYCVCLSVYSVCVCVCVCTMAMGRYYLLWGGRRQDQEKLVTTGPTPAFRGGADGPPRTLYFHEE